MYDTVLVPTDGSRPAETAARYGLTLAEYFDAAVHVVSVVDTRSYSANVADLKPRAREQRAALESDAREAVAEIEELIETESDVTYTSVVEYGVPYETIPAYAAENGIDLVVMGTHGRGGFERVLVGSVTERVVRTSEVPVLAIPPDAMDRHTPGYESILVPTDGSPAADAAVDHGLSIAERFDATVHALSVVVTGSGLLTPSDVERDGAEAAVESIAEEASRRGVAVETHVQEGSPSDEIRAFVTDREVDLVTMGTHGRSGVNRYVLGSITEKILRTSEAPVLSVRATDGE